ncbi:MAG: hypothetical protein ABFS34_14535 [Gemmatimonadota bacterium]
MSVRIDLVYFQGCPNVEAARESLRAALDSAGMGASWREWDLTSQPVPGDLRGFASPAVLIDGVSVRGDAPGPAALSCAAEGAPKASEILRALRGAP